MADPNPPRRLSPAVVIIAIVVAALVYLINILLGPRLDFAVFALHFFLAAVVAMGCALGGYLITRRAAELDLLERLVLGFAVALALLLMGTFALGLLGQIENMAALLAPLIIGGIFGGMMLVRDVRCACIGLNPSPGPKGPPSPKGEGLTTTSPSPWTPAAWLIVGLIVVLALVLLYGSWGECTDYDVLEYHAGVPAQWLHAGRIIDLPSNVYSYFPMTAEMLNLFAMGLHHDAVDGAMLGKLLGGVCTVWAALAVACVGRRLFSLRAGLAGAALFLTVPWIFYVSIMGLVEGVQTFFTLAALAAATALLVPRECFNGNSTFVPLRSKPSPGPDGPPSPKGEGYNNGSILLLALILGIIAGLTAGIKMTNLVFVLPPAALAVILAARRRRFGWKPVTAFFLAVAIFAAPFYVRNFALTGNPFFPVLSNHLGGPPGWTADLAARFARFHSPGEFTFDALKSALIGNDSVYYSFAVLFLIPFALVRREFRRRVLALLALVIFMIAAWFCCTHRIGRLLVPAWGLLAIAAGAALEAFDAIGPRAVLVAAVILIARFDVAMNLGLLESRALDLRMIRDSNQSGREVFYEFDPNTTARLWTYSPYAVQYINYEFAIHPNPKVGLIGEAETLYFTVPVVYNTVFNRSWLEPGGTPTLATVRARLAATGVTHLYVNWPEVERFSAAGNYGWPQWLNRDLFDRLEKSGALKKLYSFGPPHELPQYVIYEVVM